jgi:hypothetical protein
MVDRDEPAGPASECPDGFLMPGEMAAYLCTLEADEDPPRVIAGHIATCPVCEANWAYLKSTNPKVRLKREKDVALLVRHVVAREAHVAALVSLEDRTTAIERLAANLSAPRDGLSTELDEIEHQSAGVDPARVVALCDRVRSIDDDARRFHEASLVAEVFNHRVRSHADKDPKRYETFFILLMESKAEFIELEHWQVEFVASIPETSYFSNVALLVSEAGHFRYALRKLAELRTSFDQATTLYGPVIRAR